jgi:hypothetical protein
MRFCVLRGLWRRENMPVGKLECDHDPLLQHRSKRAHSRPSLRLHAIPKRTAFWNAAESDRLRSRSESSLCQQNRP